MINFEDVCMSYNGKSGCMCGCNGTYKLPTADHITLANESNGYDAYDESSVSPRSVKIAVSKINKALAAGSKDAAIDNDRDGKPYCAYFDDGNRNTVVYFTDAIKSETERRREYRRAKEELSRQKQIKAAEECQNQRYGDNGSTLLMTLSGFSKDLPLK